MIVIPILFPIWMWPQPKPLPRPPTEEEIERMRIITRRAIDDNLYVAKFDEHHE